MDTNGLPSGGARADHPALRIAEAVGFVLDRAAVLISTSAVVLVFLALMAEVVVRYVTKAGMGWPNEVPNLLFPWLIMGGIVVGACRGAHIAAEAIRGHLAPETLRKLLMLIHLMVALAFTFLAWLSLNVISITAGQRFPLTGIGQSWAYASMLFGFGGIALASYINVVRVAFSADPRNAATTDSTEHMT